MQTGPKAHGEIGGTPACPSRRMVPAFVFRCFLDLAFSSLLGIQRARKGGTVNRPSTRASDTKQTVEWMQRRNVAVQAKNRIFCPRHRKTTASASCPKQSRTPVGEGERRGCMQTGAPSPLQFSRSGCDLCASLHPIDTLLGCVLASLIWLHRRSRSCDPRIAFHSLGGHCFGT